jgi:hypothetical protein
LSKAKGDDRLYQTLLLDSSFFALLLRFDQDLAAEERQLGCECGGTLHRGHYARKPRGGPPGLGREHAIRFSFCCGVDGCRRRRAPASLRFLGRRVFFAVVVLLLPVLREGPTPTRLSQLEQVFAVSRRTLLRWRRWWREVFAQSRAFAAWRGRFAEPVASEALPGSLLAVMSAGVQGEQGVIALLALLAPLTSASARLGHDICVP